jgi:hypothetical protein
MRCPDCAGTGECVNWIENRHYNQLDQEEREYVGRPLPTECQRCGGLGRVPGGESPTPSRPPCPTSQLVGRASFQPQPAWEVRYARRQERADEIKREFALVAAWELLEIITRQRLRRER